VPALARLRAVPQTQEVRGSPCTLEGEIPAARVHELEQKPPALTRGEVILPECAFGRYEPVRGTIPTRPRTDHNPLDRKEYLLHAARRVWRRRRPLIIAVLPPERTVEPIATEQGPQS
jgi:ribosomal protection tetracycline resistance protein